MFDPSSFANPTPLAHADTSRDVLPRAGTSQNAFKKRKDVQIFGDHFFQRTLHTSPCGEHGSDPITGCYGKGGCSPLSVLIPRKTSLPVRRCSPLSTDAKRDCRQ
ncbi:hypothetical protein TNCV_1736061 [Trichonephila clavipes]|nr:hypothetical protein TNCV_1736061 [Trichonephila clavipes]